MAEFWQGIVFGVETDDGTFAFAVEDCFEGCFDAADGAGDVPVLLFFHERSEQVVGLELFIAELGVVVDFFVDGPQVVVYGVDVIGYIVKLR